MPEYSPYKVCKIEQTRIGKQKDRELQVTTYDTSCNTYPFPPSPFFFC